MEQDDRGKPGDNIPASPLKQLGLEKQRKRQRGEAEDEEDDPNLQQVCSSDTRSLSDISEGMAGQPPPLEQPSSEQSVVGLPSVEQTGAKLSTAGKQPAKQTLRSAAPTPSRPTSTASTARRVSPTPPPSTPPRKIPRQRLQRSLYEQAKPEQVQKIVESVEREPPRFKPAPPGLNGPALHLLRSESWLPSLSFR